MNDACPSATFGSSFSKSTKSLQTRLKPEKSGCREVRFSKVLEGRGTKSPRWERGDSSLGRLTRGIVRDDSNTVKCHQAKFVFLL